MAKLTPEEQSTSCGIGSCHPRFLQKFANIYVFTTIHCLGNLFRRMFIGVMKGSLTTMEKRFNLRSRQMGLLFSINDIGYILCVIFISYYCGKMRKPLIMGIGTIGLSISFFMFCIPHFVWGAGSATTAASLARLTSNKPPVDMCAANETIIQQCDAAQAGQDNMAYIIFVIAEVLLGASGCANFALSIAYLDDNISKKSAPFIIAISSAIPMLGPMIGLFLSSAFLKLYVDLSDTNIKPTDPEWIGAWWLGFLVTALGLFICALPMLLFPKELPRKPKRRNSTKPDEQHVQEMTLMQKPNKDKLENAPSVENGTLLKAETDKKDIDSVSQEKPETTTEADLVKKIFTNPLDLLKSIVELLKNRTYLFLILGTTCEVWYYPVYFLFLPKYLEAQFGVSRSDASLMNGCLLFTIVIGLPIGGFLMKRLKVQLRGYIFLITISVSIKIIGTFANMFNGCPTTPLPGNVSLDTGWNYAVGCELCDCDSQRYGPVCGSDGYTYFNPCYAGCTEINSTTYPKVYSSCTCLQSGSAGCAVEGRCLPECKSRLILFLVIFGTTMILVAPLHVAALMAKLRSVRKEQKPLAFGMMSFIFSVFTFLPGPIVSGTLVDTACLLWNKRACDTSGKTGNCLLYDNDRLRYVMHGTALGFFVLTVMFYLLAMRSAPGGFFGEEVPPPKETIGNQIDEEPEKAQKEEEEEDENVLVDDLSNSLLNIT